MKRETINLSSKKGMNDISSSTVKLSQTELRNINGGKAIFWRYVDGQWKIVFRS
jgi:hypothetical protein